MTQSKVVGFQLVENSAGSIVFENFLYETLASLRRQPESRSKRIVVFLDNAQVHKTPAVQTLASKMGVVLLYSAPYSPWLMPVEQLHNRLKRTIRG